MDCGYKNFSRLFSGLMYENLNLYSSLARKYRGKFFCSFDALLWVGNFIMFMAVLGLKVLI